MLDTDISSQIGSLLFFSVLDANGVLCMVSGLCRLPETEL